MLRAARRAVQRARRATVYGLTRVFCRLMVMLPVRWARRLGGWGGLAGYYLVASERAKALRSLELAYGDEKSPEERRRIAREVFRHAGEIAAEGAFLMTGRGEAILGKARLEGLEHVWPVLESGHGIIALTAHFGNWEVQLPLVKRHVKDRAAVGAIARDLSNPGLDRMAKDMRRMYDTEVFATRQSGRGYVKFLRGGGMLGVLGDIDTRGDGIFVDFFGRPSWTQVGIARLARLGRARILPLFVFRDEADPNVHVARFYAPVDEIEADGEEEWTRRVTQAFTSEIERVVRERPEHWMWMHNRWKRRPKRRKVGDQDRENDR